MIGIDAAKKIIGTVRAPSSKAHTLRALFLAALAKGKTRIENPLLADDQLIAIAALKKFGIKIEQKKDFIIIYGTSGDFQAPSEDVFVGNSGLTARFLASFAALAKGDKTTIFGDERMNTGRPMQDLLDALIQLGVNVVSVNGNGCTPIIVKADSFVGGKAAFAGNKSSQYFTSILMAAPYAKKDTKIEVIGELASKPYIDVTIDLMKTFGVKAENKGYESFRVKSGQYYKAQNYFVEGDYSNAAYFFAAAAICKGSVKVKGLSLDSKQGDAFFVKALQKMGCKIKRGVDFVEVYGGQLIGLGTVDMNNYPDIVMPLAVTSAFAEGRTELSNIEHLRIKESDRLASTVEELKKIGADASATDSSIIINGSSGKGLHAAIIDSHNDHRIAMSFAVAGLRIPGIKIENEKAVEKSFPNFFEEIKKIVKN